METLQSTKTGLIIQNDGQMLGTDMQWEEMDLIDEQAANDITMDINEWEGQF